MSHSKGPWKARGTIVFFPNNIGGFDIVGCPDAKDNALLIAAAPELLEALESLAIAYKQDTPDYELSTEWQNAMKTIAKAKGVK